LKGLNGVVQLVVTEGAADLIRDRGGRLYVWPKKSRCCGGVTTLGASTTPPRREFRAVASTDRVEVLFPEHQALMPDELHLELRWFPLRVEAYWNGCAWVT
jgi:hypothetical protein